MLPLLPQLHRRDFFRVGGLVAGGCAFSGLHSAFASSRPLARRGARSCILVYLLGGPPHLDMWDLKPEAPAEIRGPFRPIATTLPGVRICEHLPRLAQLTDKYSIIRSVSHPNNNHTPMIYYTLTGRDTDRPEEDNNVNPPSRLDHPHIGAVLAHFKSSGGMPGYVALPELAVRSNLDNVRQATLLRGGKAGFLGSRCDPLPINGDPRDPDSLPALAPPAEVTVERLDRRNSLLALMEGASSTGRDLSLLRRTAVLMTGSARGGRLYDLASEPRGLRERYGMHRFGQSLLLARRLAEAGVPMIAVHFNYMTRCDGWDTHSKNFEGLRDELLPLLDQGLSALLEDLDQRGLLQETLVVSLGEFGRTPRINAQAGRDHWGHCSAAFLAGGGIRGGAVLGASDKQAAFPKSEPVDPADIVATIYHCMGLDLHTQLRDQLNRTWALTTGQVINKLTM
jgi:uncharacterized protein (DUF1501 family)